MSVTPFLEKFPAELRNLIYEHALVDPKYIDMEDVKRKLKWPGGNKSCFALTRTCKQIRNESLPIFLGQNHFRYKGWHPSDIRPWMENFGTYLPNLKSFELHYGEVDTDRVEDGVYSEFPLWYLKEIRDFFRGYGHVKLHFTMAFGFRSFGMGYVKPVLLEFIQTNFRKASADLDSQYERNVKLCRRGTRKATQHYTYAHRPQLLEELYYEAKFFLQKLEEDPEWDWELTDESAITEAMENLRVA